MSAVLSAPVIVSERLLGKEGECKTEAEVYYNLLVKAVACLILQFGKKLECKLESCQCSIITSDQSDSRCRHRTTVRNLIRYLAEFRQIAIERLPKRIVINIMVSVDEVFYSFGNKWAVLTVPPMPSCSEALLMNCPVKVPIWESADLS